MSGERKPGKLPVEPMCRLIQFARDVQSQLTPLTRQQIDQVMTEHYPLESLLRESVDAFELCVRDLEKLRGVQS